MKSAALVLFLWLLIGCGGSKGSSKGEFAKAIVPAGCTELQSQDSGIGIYNCTQTLAELRTFADGAVKEHAEFTIADEKDGFNLKAPTKFGKFARFNTGQYVASPPGYPTPFRRDAKASGTCLSVVPEFGRIEQK